MNKKNHIIAMSVLIIIFVAGAFFGGIQYEKNKAGTSLSNKAEKFNKTNQRGGYDNQRDGQKMGGGNGAGGNFVAGDIISKDDKSITIKTKDGSSKIIFFSDSTIVGKTINGSISDLNIGEQVMINGKAGSDGSIAAQNIQIRPIAK